MKITAFCPTLNRPELLGRMIKCFEHQTYENRELVIVDDGGQYEHQSGDRWHLISVPKRILTLGEKNNVCISMAAPDSTGLAKMDDDDIYMPWWLESIAEALTRGEFVQPKKAIDFKDGRWVQVETFNHKDPNRHCYHGCWAFTRELFKRTGGYRPFYAGDDQEFDRRVKREGVRSVGLDESKYKPFYWYNRPMPGRISELGDTKEAYDSLGQNVPYVGKVPEWTGEAVWERPIPIEVIRRWW